VPQVARATKQQEATGKHSLRASVVRRSRDTLDPATRDALARLLRAATTGAVQQKALAGRAPAQHVLRHRVADGAADPHAQYRARCCRIVANVGLSEGQKVRPHWQRGRRSARHSVVPHAPCTVAGPSHTGLVAR
jgi:hypothetical protein